MIYFSLLSFHYSSGATAAAAPAAAEAPKAKEEKKEEESESDDDMGFGKMIFRCYTYFIISREKTFLWLIFYVLATDLIGVEKIVMRKHFHCDLSSR